MGAIGSGIDPAEFQTLKNDVKKIKSNLNNLTGLSDKVDSISKATASSIKYDDLALAITTNDTNKAALATAIAGNPNKLGDALAGSIGSNITVIQSLQDKLGSNTNFQTAIADTLSSDKYKVKFQGPRGSDGNIGDAGALKSNLFDTGRTMWCADGELCQIPKGKTGISVSQSAALKFGDGFTKEINAGTISYGRFDGGENGSLNIVGGGKDGQARLVRVWDTLQLGDAILRQDDDWVRITGDKNNPNAYNKGLAAASLWARDKLYVNGRDILAELNDLYNRTNLLKDHLNNHQHQFRQYAAAYNGEGTTWGTRNANAW
jgi:hypothetical protein